MYKIRYKPFFNRVQHLVAALVPNAAPRVETTGDLTLTIVECRGLMSTLLHSNVYATVGIGRQLIHVVMWNSIIIDFSSENPQKD